MDNEPTLETKSEKEAIPTPENISRWKAEDIGRLVYSAASSEENLPPIEAVEAFSRFAEMRIVELTTDMVAYQALLNNEDLLNQVYAHLPEDRRAGAAQYHVDKSNQGIEDWREWKDEFPISESWKLLLGAKIIDGEMSVTSREFPTTGNAAVVTFAHNYQDLLKQSEQDKEKYGDSFGVSKESLEGARVRLAGATLAAIEAGDQRVIDDMNTNIHATWMPEEVVKALRSLETE